MSDARRLVDKPWSYCNVLRDDGVSTIEYTEQLTYLLFLKMAHEREIRPLKPERIVPAQCSWQRLLDNDGDELKVTYRSLIALLGLISTSSAASTPVDLQLKTGACAGGTPLAVSGCSANCHRFSGII